MYVYGMGCRTHEEYRSRMWGGPLAGGGVCQRLEGSVWTKREVNLSRGRVAVVVVVMVTG